ncbi:unnamed protein product [Sphenostylis stenocarpa]|uniref:Transposase n=1 Tax=Sphenostylis stenocarpa TaxID=92480 RepID=A0AA86VQ10_9FABA|nr:unnamed protein product [Sphenostylis stenocarpa]
MVMVQDKVLKRQIEKINTRLLNHLVRAWIRAYGSRFLTSKAKQKEKGSTRSKVTSVFLKFA